MSGDLICRTELMDRALQDEYDNRPYKSRTEEELTHAAYRRIYKIIEGVQPAYDLEKVIRRLEELYKETESLPQKRKNNRFSNFRWSETLQNFYSLEDEDKEYEKK